MLNKIYLTGLILILAFISSFSCAPSNNIQSTLPSTPSVTPVKTARQYLEDGLALSEQNNYLQAIDSFTKAIELDPNSKMAFFNRGVAYSRQHQFNQALVDLNKAIELDLRYASAYYERSKVYCYINEWPHTLKDATMVIDIDPQFVQAHYIKGVTHIKQGEFNEAIKDLILAGRMDTNIKEFSDLKDITSLAIPIDEIVLLNVDMSCQQTGICNPGTCSAPIGYNTTLRLIMFVNPGNSVLQVDSINVSSNVSWIPKIALKSFYQDFGMETLATNISSPMLASGAVTCSVNYNTDIATLIKQSNTITR